MPLSSSVIPKSFSFLDRLYKTVFKGKPNIFSAWDLNRYLDAIREFQVTMSNRVGAVRENFSLAVGTAPTITTINSTEFSFTFTWTFTKTVPGEPAFVLYNGIKFKCPEPTPQTVTLTLPVHANGYNMAYAYICLVATKKTVTFNSVGTVLHVTNPKAFSGITSTDYPFELPAADNIIFGSERFVTTIDPATIVLGPDEELICIVATLRPRFWWSDASSVLSGPDNIVTAILSHNASNLQEIADTLPFVLPGLTSPHTPVYSATYKTNAGVTDVLQLLMESHLQGQSWQDNRISNAEGSLTSHINSTLAAINTINSAITDANSAINTLNSTVDGIVTSISTLINNLSGKANINQEAWRYIGETSNPAFQSGFTHALAGSGRVRFLKDNFGVVRIQGIANKAGGTVAFGDVIFTLPDGYKPTSTIAAPICHSTGNSVSVDGVTAVLVHPTGQISFPVFQDPAWDHFHINISFII